MKSHSIIRTVLVSLILSGFTNATYSDEIKVAVASNFIKPMKALKQAFEDDTAHTVKLTTGSSGKIFAQIKHGAPYDVFFSADQIKVTKLLEENLAQVGSRVTYAIGRLVLWAPNNTFATPNALLESASFNRLALANPRLAPYGLAAKETLSQLTLLESSQKKWVMAENISQSYQFVFTANAELGFVAYSQVHDLMTTEASQGSAHVAKTLWLVPENFHSPIKQDAVILKGSKHGEAAQALISFIQSDEAKAIIETFGYQTL